MRKNCSQAVFLNHDDCAKNSLFINTRLQITCTLCLTGLFVNSFYKNFTHNIHQLIIQFISVKTTLYTFYTGLINPITNYIKEY